MITQILSWAVFGLIAGGIAKLILPGKDPGGAILTIIIGIVGSMLGGWIGHTFFASTAATGAFSLKSFMWAVIGAIVLLIAYRIIFGSKRR